MKRIEETFVIDNVFQELFCTKFLLGFFALYKVVNYQLYRKVKVLTPTLFLESLIVTVSQWFWQAKSPIRTLDEFNVIEVVSSLHFPSVSEREQSNCLGEDPSLGVIKSESELSHLSAIPCQVSIEGSNCETRTRTRTVFGMRRQHRCFVVTARARSFLYHQVGITSLLRFFLPYLHILIYFGLQGYCDLYN